METSNSGEYHRLLSHNKNLIPHCSDFGLARTLPGKTKEGQLNDQNDPHLTLYVVTRWYRAPEVLLRDNSYSFSVDVWAAGCVFAELYTLGAPLFRGNGPLNQLMRIFGVIGTPLATDVQDIACAEALHWLREQPPLRGRGLKSTLAVYTPHYQRFAPAGSSPCNRSTPNSLPVHPGSGGSLHAMMSGSLGAFPGTPNTPTNPDNRSNLSVCALRRHFSVSPSSHPLCVCSPVLLALPRRTPHQTRSTRLT